MKLSPKNSFIFASTLLLLGLFSCNQDKLEQVAVTCDLPVTYNTDVKAILDESCAYSGCHNGGLGGPGDFSNYAGLQAFLTPDLFENRVINLRSDVNLGMPPNYAPADKPQDLTDAQIETIQCWISRGYPE